MDPGDGRLYSYFWFDNTVVDFLFKGWSTDNGTGLFLMCFACIGMTVLLEVYRTISELLSVKVDLSCKTSCRKKCSSQSACHSTGQEDTSDTARLVNTNNSSNRIIRVICHSLKSLIAALQMCVGYLLMLAIMSYNGYIFLSVILCSTACYLVFDVLRAYLKAAVIKRHDNQSMLINLNNSAYDGEVVDRLPPPGISSDT